MLPSPTDQPNRYTQLARLHHHDSGRLNPYATDVGRVLVDEKRREDAMRQRVNGVTRWTWNELDPSRERALASRLRADLARSAQLSRRIIDLGA